MIAVFRTRVFGCYKPSADLTGEAVAARVCFIVTLFKCFPFIFTVHDKFLLKMFNVFSGGTVSVDLPNLPFSPHSPKINYTFSKKYSFEFLFVYYSVKAAILPDWIADIFREIFSLSQSHQRSLRSSAMVSSSKRLRIGFAGTPPTMV